MQYARANAVGKGTRGSCSLSSDSASWGVWLPSGGNKFRFTGRHWNMKASSVPSAWLVSCRLENTYVFECGYIHQSNPVHKGSNRLCRVQYEACHAHVGLSANWWCLPSWWFAEFAIIILWTTASGPEIVLSNFPEFWADEANIAH